MKITISFRNLEHTKALDEKIRQKSERLKKYFEGHVDIQWFCYVKDNEHHADIKLMGPTIHANASAKSDNLYKTFDLVVTKIEKQLQKKKEKWNKIHSNAHKKDHEAKAH